MIRIYGYGTVGQATHAIFNHVCEHFQIIDPIKGYYRMNAWKLEQRPDVIFICVPIINVNGTQSVENVINILNDLRDEYKCAKSHELMNVCIRSTITYKNFIKLQKAFRKSFRFTAMPEFLNENTAFSDAKSESLLIGGEYNDIQQFEYIIARTGKAYEMVSAKDACDFKYIHNLYGAFKVLFWEMCHDVTDGRSRQMYRLYQKFKSGDMASVGMDGQRGAGGKCFPENLETMKDAHKIIEAMYDYNQTLLKLKNGDCMFDVDKVLQNILLN